MPPNIVKVEEHGEWRDCHQAFVVWLLHNYVFAESCSHKIWQDNPELVANEIIKQYKQVTKQKR